MRVDLLEGYSSEERKTIKEAIVSTHWHCVNSRCDWRQYVPVVFRKAWDEMSEEAKLAVYVMADAMVACEDL